MYVQLQHMQSSNFVKSSRTNQGMDNKKTRFSPSSIDEVERDTITRLIGTENRYDVPEHFKGRTQTLWDSLAQLFHYQTTQTSNPTFAVLDYSAQCLTVSCRPVIPAFVTNA